MVSETVKLGSKNYIKGIGSLPLKAENPREDHAMPSYSRRKFNIAIVSMAMVSCVIERLAADTSEPGQEPQPFSRSGDDDLDRAMINELKRIVRVFQVNPGFKYVDQMNAYATQETIVAGTRGTVFLGLPFIRSLIDWDASGIAVAGTYAHECAHIYQFDHQLTPEAFGRNGASLRELHADFLGGYYIGRRQGFVGEQVRAFSRMVFRFGGPERTSGQRAAAVEKGYATANDGTNLFTAVEIGRTYVANL
jgi:hypothetical protein